MSSPPRRVRLWRAVQARTESDPGAADSIAALQAEVVLLREENAALKAEQHQTPDIGPLVKRARALPASATDRDDVGDEASQLMVEGLVLRESLLEVCQELQRSIAAVEKRLTALAPAKRASRNGARRKRKPKPVETDAKEGHDGAGPG